jgi:hypothetical protein
MSLTLKTQSDKLGECLTRVRIPTQRLLDTPLLYVRPFVLNSIDVE